MIGLLPSGVLAWHWSDNTLRDGRRVPPPFKTLVETEPLKLGRSGLHASLLLEDSFPYAPGPFVHRVLSSGEIIFDKDKLVSSERTILWSHKCSAWLFVLLSQNCIKVLIEKNKTPTCPEIEHVFTLMPPKQPIREEKYGVVSWAANALSEFLCETRDCPHKKRFLDAKAFALAEGSFSYLKYYERINPTFHLNTDKASSLFETLIIQEREGALPPPPKEFSPCVQSSES